MPNYIVSDASINQIVFAYLRDMGYSEALTALQLETGCAEGSLGSDLLYLNRLTLEGRWEDVLTYLRPMQRVLLGEYNRILYIVKKQQYLESLCWQGNKMRNTTLPWKPPTAVKKTAAGAAEEPEQELLNLDYICELLKSLEPLCLSQKEYNSLLTNLTLEALTDNPDYRDWTVCGGRLDCFSQLRNLLHNITPGQNDPDPASGGRGSCALVETLGMALAYMESNGNPLTDFAFANQTSEENVIFDYSDRKIKPLAMLDHYNETLAVPSVKVIRCGSAGNRGGGVNISASASSALRSSHDKAVNSSNGNTNTNTNTSDVSISTDFCITANAAQALPSQPAQPPSPPRISTTKSITAWEIPASQAAPALDDKKIHSNSALKQQQQQRQEPLSWDVNLKPIDRSGANDESVEEKLSLQASSSSAIAKFAPPLRRRSSGYEGGRAHSPLQSRYSDTHNKVGHASGSRGGGALKAPSHRPLEKKRQISNSVFLTAAPDSSVSVSNDGMKDAISATKSAYPVKAAEGRSFSSAYEVVDERPQSNTANAAAARPSGVRSGGSDLGPKAIHSRATASSGVSLVSAASSALSVNSADKWDNVSQRAVALKQATAADSSQAFTGTAAAEKITSIEYTTLYQTNCPLRSVSILADGNKMMNLKSTTIAIGSNAKNIHTVRYDNAQGGGRSGITVHKQNDYNDVHKGSVYAIDWSPSVRLLASGSNDKIVNLTAVDSPHIKPVALKGHTGTVRIVKFRGGSEEVLASGGAGDFKVRLWDVTSGSLITALAQHTACVQGLAWLDENTFLSGCEKGLVACSDLRSRKIAWTFDLLNDVSKKSSNICTMAKCSADYVVVGCAEGFASIISNRDRSVVKTERLHKDDIRGVSCIAASGVSGIARAVNSVYVSTSSFDGLVGVWKVDFNALSSPSMFRPLSILRGHTDKVLSTTFNHANGDIVTSGADGSVLLWRGSSL